LSGGHEAGEDASTFRPSKWFRSIKNLPFL